MDSAAYDGPHIDEHHYVARLVPAALVDMAPEMRAALDDGVTAIEPRAVEVADRAIREGAPWLASLPPRPDSGWQLDRWEAAVIAAAAYRDRYGITGMGLDADMATSREQRRDV
ncbi:hypothetical protein ACNHYB_00330 [Isoptericola jiangsuensis]|uniref:hypothetical protein n=1 Tax=Isoptericola jiangsuensis TaxID=548579 RepID=UPI003AAD4D3B